MPKSSRKVSFIIVNKKVLSLYTMKVQSSLFEILHEINIVQSPLIEKLRIASAIIQRKFAYVRDIPTTGSVSYSSDKFCPKILSLASSAAFRLGRLRFAVAESLS